MTDNASSTTSTTSTVPVTRARVAECRESAGYWVRELPRYADRKQRQADGWAIAAGIVIALTGLSIWPVSTETSTLWIRLMVAGGALAAAVCALVPRVYNFGELAGQAREITGKYGHCYGELVDLDEAPTFDCAAAAPIVADFEAAKARKDGLRGLPLRPLGRGRDRDSAAAGAIAALAAQLVELTAQVKGMQATKPTPPAVGRATSPESQVTPEMIEQIARIMVDSVQADGFSGTGGGGK